MTSMKISRRSTLMFGSAFTLLGATGGMAFSNTPGRRKFVLIVLRGAMDGLAAVAPYADPNYRAMRGRLALDAPGSEQGVLPISDGFGLHPQLSFMHESWAARELAILHACASPYRDRSHFDAQDVLESGGTQVFEVRDGWLNRAISALPAEIRGEGLAIANTIPLVLRGPAPATSWAPSLAPAANSDTLNRLADLYSGDQLLAPILARAIQTEAIAAEQDMTNTNDRRGRAGPAAAYRTMAEAAARLLAAPNGPTAAVLSFDGWDTHANQGGAQGNLAFRLAGLDTALRALKDGLGSNWLNTTVVVATEFGRTVAENGTGGTDHGTGGAAFVLGGAVNGGRMLGDWPGIAPGALYEGRDLAPVNDVRELFIAVLSQHWGLERGILTNRVFPQASQTSRYDGLIRA